MINKGIDERINVDDDFTQAKDKMCRQFTVPPPRKSKSDGGKRGGEVLYRANGEDLIMDWNNGRWLIRTVSWIMNG